MSEEGILEAVASEASRALCRGGNPAPNYKTWGQRDHWKEDEAVALSLGLHPPIVEQGIRDASSVRVLAREMRERSETFSRATGLWKFNHWGPRTVEPERFLERAKDLDMPFPKELEEAVATYRIARLSLREQVERLKEESERLRAALIDGSEAGDDVPADGQVANNATISYRIAIAWAAFLGLGKDGSVWTAASMAAQVADQTGMRTNAESIKRTLRNGLKKIGAEKLKNGKNMDEDARLS